MFGLFKKKRRIKNNEDIELTKEQYEEAKVRFAGIVAHREEKGRYFIRLWIPGYKKRIEQFLNETSKK